MRTQTAQLHAYRTTPALCCELRSVECTSAGVVRYACILFAVRAGLMLLTGDGADHPRARSSPQED